jgi:alkylation response protein AidB-like acyl-CoA dehydrogenase
VITPTEAGVPGPCDALRARLAEAAVDGGLFSPGAIAELDRAEAFPADQCRLLDEFGLAAYYVPVEWGGELDDYETLLQLVRTVATHDLSTAVAHAKTFLGAICVWLAGEPGQARALAGEILAGARVSWALSERDHGADLLAGAATGRRAGSGYRLDATKWPINNATRCSRVCVLVRTAADRGGRGHSLFLVDKAAFPPDAVRVLPKVPTHGVRGIDISGIVLDGAVVDESARVGDEGAGAETVLRALQLTRTVCTGLSLGAGEHALRLATTYACDASPGRRPLVADRRIRAILARSAGLLFATESAVMLAARSINALPTELGAVSAVAKALAPTLVDRVIGELGELLGAQAWLTDGLEHGAFQKLQRDHQVVAIFDGSTAVSRNALINQFPRLARRYATATADAGGLRVACRLGGSSGPAMLSKLTLVSRGGVSALGGLAAAVQSIAHAGCPPALLADAQAALRATDLLHDRLTALRPAARPAIVAYELAAVYELCFAAAACVHMWMANVRAAEPHAPWDGALWARAALRELCIELHGFAAAHTPDACLDVAVEDVGLADALVDWLVEAVARGDRLSPFPGTRRLGDAG